MDEVAGTRTFSAPAAAYDAFMGRYSVRLAPVFADFCLPDSGPFLDVGCGPGALTGVAVERLGADAVWAVDPTLGFVEACRARYPGVDVGRAAAEDLPFEDARFAGAAAQLVLHFVTDPAHAAAEMRRVTRPGGVVAAAVWDAVDGMEMLTAFWRSVRSLGLGAPEGSLHLRFGAPGELGELFGAAGLVAVEEVTFTVAAGYRDFDELWDTLLSGIGPAGAYVAALDPGDQVRLRDAVHGRLGAPQGSFSLTGVARAARGRVSTT